MWLGVNIIEFNVGIEHIDINQTVTMVINWFKEDTGKV